LPRGYEALVDVPPPVGAWPAKKRAPSLGLISSTRGVTQGSLAVGMGAAELSAVIVMSSRCRSTARIGVVGDQPDAGEIPVAADGRLLHPEAHAASRPGAPGLDPRVRGRTLMAACSSDVPQGLDAQTGAPRAVKSLVKSIGAKRIGCRYLFLGPGSAKIRSRRSAWSIAA
jgi:hypothetical protein